MTLRSTLLLLASVVLVAQAASAWTKTSTTATTTIHATGTGGFRFEAKTEEMTITETDKALVVTVPLANLNTGIELRDHHMKKYLEAEKFPDVKIEVSKDDLKVTEPGKDVALEGKGLFTLHGKTKEVPFKYKGSCNALHVCDVSAEATISYKDFAIEVPSYMGITVKPDVRIETTFQVQQPTKK